VGFEVDQAHTTEDGPDITTRDLVLAQPVDGRLTTCEKAARSKPRYLPFTVGLTVAFCINVAEERSVPNGD
jgi:hypothetical protein